MRKLKFLKTICVYLVALSIPCFLVLATVQTREYSKIENEISSLEEKQNELIEQNYSYVANISNLSSSNRIEKVATEELGMRKADSNEIVRISIEGNK